MQESRNWKANRYLFSPIFQQFYAAKTPSTFAVNLSFNWCWDGRPEVVEFHLDNTIGEQLHGVWTEETEEMEVYRFRITRHPANDNMGLQEWINANKRKGRGRIELYNSSVG